MLLRPQINISKYFLNLYIHHEQNLHQIRPGTDHRPTVREPSDPSKSNGPPTTAQRAFGTGQPKITEQDRGIRVKKYPKNIGR